LSPGFGTPGSEKKKKKIRKGAEADRRKNRDKLGQVKKARLPESKIKL